MQAPSLKRIAIAVGVVSGLYLWHVESVLHSYEFEEQTSTLLFTASEMREMAWSAKVGAGCFALLPPPGESEDSLRAFSRAEDKGWQCWDEMERIRSIGHF